MLTAALSTGALADIAGCDRSLDQWTLRHFTTADGLALDTVYALAADRDGFVWVGTEDGLSRFDGQDFEHVDLQPVIGGAPPFIRTLLVGESNTLFAGVSSSGVVTVDTRTGRARSMALPLRSSIEALHEDNGRLLIGARGETLLRLDPDDGEIAVPGASERSIRAIARRSGGGFWVGYDGGGVELLEDDRLRSAPFREAPNPFISALAEDLDGRLWVGTREGLFSWDGSALEHHGESAGLIDRAHVVSLHVDARGHLWVGTGGEGIARLCRGRERFERFGLEGELGRSHINDFLEDRDGSLWIASGGDGLYQLLRGAAMPLGREQGMPPYPVLPIVQGGNDAMWLGTFGGGVVRLDEQGMRVFSEGSASLEGDHVLSLAPDGEGVWAGTRTGLNRIEGDRVTQPFETSLATVSALLAEDGRLWIGSVDGLFMAHQGRLESVPMPQGEAPGHILMLRRDSSGRLWVGSDSHGLHYLDPGSGRLEPAPFAERLPSRTVYDLEEFPEGVLWFATSRGLVRVVGDEISVVDSRHGLVENIAFSIRRDGHGNVWTSGNRGVFRMPQAQLEAVADGRRARLEMMHFDQSDGMPRSETNGGFQYAVWRDRSGRLWYPTSEGAAIFDPEALAGRGASPKAHLVRARNELGGVDLGDLLQLPPGSDWLRLHYTAPAFLYPDDIEFRYRLGGYDEGWFVTPERSALYRQLPPGEYRFEVQARLPAQDWSTAARQEVEVGRFWYEYAWVRILVGVIAAALLLALAYWMIVRRQRRQAREAQAQKLEAIGLLAGGVAHDFNNVLTVIMNGIELMRMKLPIDSTAHEDADRMMKASERAAGLTRQLLTFARRQQAEPDWLDLGRELESAREFLAPVIPSRIELCLETESRLGYCLIDSVQFQQVLMNLIINARDAMGGSGRIRVRARSADAQMLRQAGLPASRHHVCIEVSDTGPGVQAGDERRVFEPFFTTKAGALGTGLGLAVVHGIVDQAGGWIGVRSTPGQGATFTVVLPVVFELVDPDH